MMEDPEFWIKVLTLKEVSAVGILLACSGLFLLALFTNRIYTAGRHKDALSNCEKTCDTCTDALTICQTSVRQCENDYRNSQISIARFEERERFQSWQPPTRKPRGQ
jgi:hypothetical protein